MVVRFGWRLLEQKGEARADHHRIAASVWPLCVGDLAPPGRDSGGRAGMDHGLCRLLAGGEEEVTKLNKFTRPLDRAEIRKIEGEPFEVPPDLMREIVDRTAKAMMIPPHLFGWWPEEKK